MYAHQRRRAGGFSTLEFMLVVAISGILVLGLSAIIDVPAKMAEKEEAENPSIAHTEGAIAALDRGRRFNDPGVFCERAFGTFFPIYE